MVNKSEDMNKNRGSVKGAAKGGKLSYEGNMDRDRAVYAGETKLIVGGKYKRFTEYSIYLRSNTNCVIYREHGKPHSYSHELCEHT